MAKLKVNKQNIFVADKFFGDRITEKDVVVIKYDEGFLEFSPLCDFDKDKIEEMQGNGSIYVFYYGRKGSVEGRAYFQNVRPLFDENEKGKATFEDACNALKFKIITKKKPKYIYIVENLKNGKEYAFYDFELVERYIKTLQNGTFNFKKIEICEEHTIDEIIEEAEQK